MYQEVAILKSHYLDMIERQNEIGMRVYMKGTLRNVRLYTEQEEDELETIGTLLNSVTLVILPEPKKKRSKK